MNASIRAALIAAGTAVALWGCNAIRGASTFAPPTTTGAIAGARAADAGTRASADVRGLHKPIALDAPIALAEDKHGNLYVGNAGKGANEILVYSPHNQQLTSETIKHHVRNPAGLAFDRKGDLYVVDVLTHEVTVFSPSRHFIRRKTLHTDSSNGLTPSGVQIDLDGNIWVASRDDGDYGVGEVQVFNSRGKLIHTVTQHLEYPVGIVFVGTEAWVCNSTTPTGDSFTVLDADANYVKTIPTPGFTPTYAAFRRNKIYATDGVTSQLEEFDTSGSLVKTIDTGLDAPYGVAVKKTGDFYVANVGNNTISEFSRTGRLIRTIK